MLSHTRKIEVLLHPEDAKLYDELLTGNDDDLLLAVEKTIVAKLNHARAYDPDWSHATVEVSPVESVTRDPS